LEPMSGADSLERVSASSLHLGGSGLFRAQFESDDKNIEQARSDERIKLAVMTALYWDLAVPRDRVQVSVDHGRVSLTGRVARDYERSRAEAVAGVVPGVVGVTNNIAFLGEG
jgi:osmotically-inducible protein OsmY